MSIAGTQRGVVREQPRKGTNNNVQDATNPEVLDPRVSELIGFADATRRSGFSYWTYHNAYRAGRLRGVTVPGGAVGLLREDVDAFDREHRERLRLKRQAKAEATE